MSKKRQANEQLCGTTKNTCVWWNNNASKLWIGIEIQADVRQLTARSNSRNLYRCFRGLRRFFVARLAYRFHCRCCRNEQVFVLNLFSKWKQTTFTSEPRKKTTHEVSPVNVCLWRSMRIVVLLSQPPRFVLAVAHEWVLWFSEKKIRTDSHLQFVEIKKVRRRNKTKSFYSELRTVLTIDVLSQELSWLFEYTSCMCVQCAYRSARGR